MISKRLIIALDTDDLNLVKKLSAFLNIKKENILLTSGIDGGIKTIFEIIFETVSKTTL